MTISPAVIITLRELKMFAGLVFLTLALSASDVRAQEFRAELSLLNSFSEDEYRADSPEEMEKVHERHRERLRNLLPSKSFREVIHDLNDSDLEFLLDEIGYYNVRNPDAYGLTIARATFEEIEKRNIVSEVGLLTYYQTLFYFREWEELKILFDRYSALGLGSVPNIVSADDLAGHRKVFVSSADRESLLERSLPFQQFTGVIFVGSNGCGFSRHAAEVLADDNMLREIFSENALFFEPPGRSLNESPFVTFLDLPTMQVVDRDDWPEIPTYATPSFFFFEDGEYHGWVRGWPLDSDAEKLQEIRRYLRSINLLPEGGNRNTD